MASPNTHPMMMPAGAAVAPLPFGMVPRLSPGMKPGPSVKARSPPKAPPSPKSSGGDVQAGVGVFFQQETSGVIYVASMVPNGAAARDGQIREGDELVGINSISINQQTTLENLRQLILGPPGTFVMLSMRRRVNGGSARDDYWYYDLELQRGDGGHHAQDAAMMQRSLAPAAQRSAPPPGYNEEIANLREQVNMLRRMQGTEEDARLAPLESELQERISDLQRFERMYERARERVEESHRQCEEAKVHLSQLEQTSQQLRQQDTMRSAHFQDLHRESGSQLGRMDSALGEVESEIASEKQACADYEQRIREAEEELATLRKLSKTSIKDFPHLREKLYQTHEIVLQAIREQEEQMQVLSDIIPALDMVHSSLVSSISIDPVRLQSYNTSNPPSAPQITAIPGLESISLSSSLRGMPQLSSSMRGLTVQDAPQWAPQRQYVAVGLSQSMRSVPLGASMSNISLSSSFSRAPVDGLRRHEPPANLGSSWRGEGGERRQASEYVTRSASFAAAAATHTGVPYFASMGHAGLGIGQSLSSSFTGNKSAYEYHLGSSLSRSRDYGNAGLKEEYA
eukprot:Tamp_08112.p1 GENE.Tamp_08112~~Tamp_08112.p1  ORF type:complete len:570 (+),score=86.36 Tamp_08112:324-2033(+)